MSVYQELKGGGVEEKRSGQFFIINPQTIATTAAITIDAMKRIRMRFFLICCQQLVGAMLSGLIEGTGSELDTTV